MLVAQILSAAAQLQNQQNANNNNSNNNNNQLQQLAVAQMLSVAGNKSVPMTTVTR